MKIVELTIKNYPQFANQIAEIHKRAYSSKHMTAHFSQKMLEEYYRNLVEESELCVLSLDDSLDRSRDGEEQVIGFIIAGTAVSKGVANYLRSNRFNVLSVMLKHPVFLFQKIATLFLSRCVKAKQSSAKFRLLSIGVDNRSQSSGVGRAMLSFFEQELLKRGINTYGLSVRSSSKRAIVFYEKNGFKLEKNYLGSKYFAKNLEQ